MFFYNFSPPGVRHVANIPNNARTEVSLLEEGMHYAFLESSNGNKRLTVNGTTGSWFQDITSIVFSPFNSYFYNVIHGDRHGFIINGKEYLGDDCRCWELALDGVALWTCANSNGKGRTFIGTEKALYSFSSYAELTADFRSFIYIGVGEEDNHSELLVRGAETVFKGSVLGYEVLGDRTRVSWVGALPGSDRCHPYLEGRRQSRSMDILCYSPLSFTVCPLHRRYLLGEHEEHLGPIRLVLDDESLSFLFPEPTLFDSGFSDDSKSWYCIADQRDGNASVVRDGKMLGVYAQATDAQFLGDQFVYTAQLHGQPQSSSWRLFRDARPDKLWAGFSLVPDTLRSSANGDLACVARENGADPDAAPLLFVCNGMSLWEFDELPGTQCAYFSTDASPIRFLEDGRVICAGIKGGELMVYVAEP